MPASSRSASLASTPAPRPVAMTTRPGLRRRRRYAAGPRPDRHRRFFSSATDSALCARRPHPRLSLSLTWAKPPLLRRPFLSRRPVRTRSDELDLPRHRCPQGRQGSNPCFGTRSEDHAGESGRGVQSEIRCDRRGQREAGLVGRVLRPTEQDDRRRVPQGPDDGSSDPPVGHKASQTEHGSAGGPRPTSPRGDGRRHRPGVHTHRGVADL